MKIYYLRLFCILSTFIGFSPLSNLNGQVSESTLIFHENSFDKGMLSDTQYCEVSGVVFDENMQPISGVYIRDKSNSISGGVTDENGEFNIKVPIPNTLLFSHIGFTPFEKTVDSTSVEKFIIKLIPQNKFINPIVIGASRYSEKLLEAPVAIYKLENKQLKTLPTFDAYDGIKYIKGVQENRGSISFPSYNMRGFADPNNLRLKQKLDGYDLNNPVGLVVGNALGVSDLDLLSIEVLPGASTAIHGPDAFNGIILMYSKSPFYHEGISAVVKTGITRSSPAGNNPLLEYSMRYAKKLNSKIAFKIDLSLLKAEDWKGGMNEHKIITNNDWDNRDSILNKNLDSPDYNSLFRLGDGDAGTGVVGHDIELNYNGQIDTIPRLLRSGINETDLFDFNIFNYRISTSLHYKLNENLELIGTYKYSTSDWHMRNTSIFPQLDYQQELFNFQVKGDKLRINAYRHELNSSKGSWHGDFAANYIQTNLRSNEDWLADYKTKYFETGSHKESRLYADRFLPGGSEFEQSRFDQLKSETTGNFDLINGGAAFKDLSSYSNLDFSYDLSTLSKNIDLILGTNIRYFQLKSDGTFYNDGEYGFDGPIGLLQFGGFIDISKKIRKLKVNTSIRLDKHEAYNIQITPRLTAVYNLKNSQFLRGSIQTGFRNPGVQEGFIRLPVSLTTTVLGTSELNIENYSHVAQSGEIPLKDIFTELGLTALIPEKITMAELGYKAYLRESFYLDINFFKSIIRDAIFRPASSFRQNTPDFHVFLAYKNSEEKITSYGFGIELAYFLNKRIHAKFNYEYITFGVPSFDSERNQGLSLSDYKRSLRFNTPNHRIGFSLFLKELGVKERFGIQSHLSYTSEYNFFSNTGQTVIPNIFTTDLSASYKISQSLNLMLGLNNIFANEYSYLYQGASIGSIYFVKLTFGI